VFERFDESVRFEADGGGVRENTAVIRIQSQAGVQALGQLVFGYSTANEDLKVDYVRVRRPDGQLVETPASTVQDFAPPPCPLVARPWVTPFFRVRAKGWGYLLAPPLKQQRPIRPAKTKRVRHGVFERGFPRVVGDKVHVAGAGVLIFKVNSRRKNLVAQGEHSNASFEASGAAQQMSSHGFC
jgi:uncharacterized protein DUF3857